MIAQNNHARRLWPVSLALAFALTACGGDNDQDSDSLGLSAPYRGQWKAAFLEPGKTDPKPFGCLQTDADLGLTLRVNNSEFAMTSIVSEFPGKGARTCTGADALTSTTTAVIKRIDASDASETITFDSFTYTIKVGGPETVDLMNILVICDRNDWQQRSYSHLDDQLKNCTEGNTAGVNIPTRDKLSGAKFQETRFQRQGNGLAISSRDSREKDSRFEPSGYYAR